MCGIAGLINKNNSPVTESVLRAVTSLVERRGPDAEGYFLENNIGLGHRRLSIIDISEDANQPMKFDDKYVIVFNGEIYNYIEVKEQLLKYGYSFKTKSDTEVILAAYDKWKEKCVEHFNGMWSFAIYNRKEKIFFCSRDRFGEKPFYFAENENIFVFGSTIKQMLFFQKPVVNLPVLLDYLVLGFEDYSSETFFKKIFKLLPSHNLIYDLTTGNITVKKYFLLKKDEALASADEEDILKLFKNKFNQSVSLRLRSDVKVGTCLSGGLDSSSIAASAVFEYHKKSKLPFSAITAKSIMPEKDETLFASIVVDKLKLDWLVVEPTEKDFISNVDNIIAVQEEPFGSPSIIMQYFVMQEAKKSGNIVMLDGQGGDETLLGYERYFVSYIASLPWSKRKSALKYCANNSKLTQIQLLLYYFYFLFPEIRLNRQRIKHSFIKSKYLDCLNKNLIIEFANCSRNISDLQILEITKTQLPHLLKYEDSNAMWHSIETRLPFLDHELVELSLALPTNLKIRNGWTKYILRKNMENDLPKEICWRKNKLGFEAPSQKWLGSAINIYEEINRSSIIREISHKQINNISDTTLLWKLYNIAKWEKIFNVTLQ